MVASLEMKSEWISVKDRLPIKEEIQRNHWFFVHFVIEKDGYEEHLTSMRPFSNGKFGYPHEECTEICDHNKERVINWMPLPQPPKEE
mgnify:CR=1 FL=1